MSRYRGVDWQADPEVGCNGSLNPMLDLMNDGMNADPFELLFVKVCAWCLLLTFELRCNLGM
jgi:hypothetical protein